MSDKKEDCTTCEHGKKMVGVILCEQSGRIITKPAEGCDNYEKRTEQVKLDV